MGGIKVNDIRPSDLMEKKKPALEHDKAYLRERRELFIEIDCPACQSQNHAFWGEKEGFSYRKCSSCQTLFMSPRATEKLLAEFYMQSKNYEFWNNYIFPATDSVRKEKIFLPRAKKTIEFCKKYDIHGGTLLEIGSAYGTYCDAIREQNFFDQIIAVEPTPGLADTCRKKGFITYEQTVELLDYPQGAADVIANFEVIEHLGDPAKFVRLAVQFLRSGGLFLCTCPNGMGLGTLVLEKDAGVIDHEHLNYFNPKSLSLLLESCQLQVLETLTPGELDVDLLVNAVRDNPALIEGQPFFQHLINNTSEEVHKAFQKFLRQNLLSSHLWIVARKN